MRNWSVDTSRLNKNSREYEIWQAEVIESRERTEIWNDYLREVIYTSFIDTLEVVTWSFNQNEKFER